MDLELKDKVAVITGGSTVIGLAVGCGLAREGVNVALCARDEARLAEQARVIEQRYGTKALGLRADVTQPADLEHLADEVERVFGGADILINNAGTGTNETMLISLSSSVHHARATVSALRIP